LPTDYRYNSLNQVVAQQSPDGGVSEFWYDRLGRLTISSNAKQKTSGIAADENHLYSCPSGHNAAAAVSDLKKPVASSTDPNLIAYYDAMVTSANDYYPFGMIMPARQVVGNGYNFGFNGKENDNEVKGVEGTQQDYGMRIYDPRLGRFLSVDPLTQSYPWYTPYQFAGNKPIWATDVDGLEENTASTHVYKPPVLALKPAFRGVISITDATSQRAHKTFEGDFSKLSKADQSGFSRGIVNALVGSNIGTSESRLDITQTGTRSEVSKSWKGTDMKYFTQYSYTFTNNNVTEIGTFEMQTGSVQASARAWDPLALLLVNKVVSSIVSQGIATGTRTAYQSTTVESLEASQKVYNGATLYRLGTSGVSKTGSEAQFWSLENPLTMSAEEYAKKYGIKLSNVKNADFIETATLRPGAKYITRQAPTMEGAPAGAGGGMEAVVEKGGTIGNVITPIKR
jgi:RHS repeat-associated protein